MEIKQLQQMGQAVRVDIVKMLGESGSGHPGGSLSLTDLIVTLYFNHLTHNPKNPTWEGRDYVILSKGHTAPALYSVLAESGYFPKEELMTLRKLGSRLQGHPAKDENLPGVEISTGSLGHGLSVGVGIALGMRIDKKHNKVYVLMGCGEQQEGSVWEAAMAAGHFKLANLIAVIDYNKIQIDGKTEEIMGIDSLIDKYKSFRWNVIEIDGHNYPAIDDAFNKAKKVTDKPTVIIANTVKGKGVSFMENTHAWHGKAPKKEEVEKAIAEIMKG